MHIFMLLLCVFAQTLSRENNIYIKLEVVWYERAMMQAAGSKYKAYKYKYIYIHICMYIVEWPYFRKAKKIENHKGGDSFSIHLLWLHQNHISIPFPKMNYTIQFVCLSL